MPFGMLVEKISIPGTENLDLMMKQERAQIWGI